MLFRIRGYYTSAPDYKTCKPFGLEDWCQDVTVYLFSQKGSHWVPCEVLILKAKQDVEEKQWHLRLQSQCGKIMSITNLEDMI